MICIFLATLRTTSYPEVVDSEQNAEDTGEDDQPGRHQPVDLVVVEVVEHCWLRMIEYSHLNTLD